MLDSKFYIYIYMCVCVRVCMYVCMYVRVCVYVCVCVCGDLLRYTKHEIYERGVIYVAAGKIVTRQCTIFGDDDDDDDEWCFRP